MKTITNSKFSRISSYIIFWSWNIIFLIFLFAVILPPMGAGIFTSFFSGEIPFDFFILLIIGTSIPIISVVLGLTKFKKDPKRLFRLFYGIEIPLGFIIFLRLWLLRELTPGTWQLLILMIFGGLVFLFDLISRKEIVNKTLDIVRFCGHTVLLLIALYFGIIMLFYFIPLISSLVIGFFSFEWVNDIGFFIQAAFISFFFLVISGTILLILPIAMPTLYIKKFISGIKEFTGKYSPNFSYTIAITVIIVNIILFAKLNIQPQQKAFEMLHNNNLTDHEKTELLEKGNFIRKGLLNAYLASYRYIASADDNSIEFLYQDIFNMNDKTAKTIQKMYNTVIKPFVYDGENHWYERQKANNLYMRFFDAPIQKAEYKSIKNALQATWDRDGIEAGLLNINDKKVHILEQNINIKEENGVAEIEICETYQNKTTEQQEIFYYFSLPEHAVITGLWLSDDGTDKKYPFAVSPRGAAQQVYKNEVRQRVDPSLLEQTGPGQYRLRAFPIPGISSRERNLPDFEKGDFDDKLKLWFSYVCTSIDGNYLLPRLTEKRNVYWNKKTKLTLNGKAIKKLDFWLPDKIPAKTSFSFPNVQLNDDICISASHLNDIDIKTIPGKYALLVDPSYSMNNLKEYVDDVIEEFLSRKISCDVLYFKDSTIHKTKITDFDLDKLIFFGSSTFYDLLIELKENINLNMYDELILLTDAGSYELNQNIAEADDFFIFEEEIQEENDQRTSFDFGIPVNFLHVNYKFPQSYDDAVLETVEKSSGVVSGNSKDLLQKIMVKRRLNFKYETADPESRLLWKISSENVNNKQSVFGPIRQLAAKQYIKLLVQQQDSISLSLLDKIHEIAKTNNIITPYSSMIVLVNDRQKEALKEAEQDIDRFERETETGMEETTNSSLGIINVTGTPEPEEWILIIITALMLIFFYSKYLKR